MLILLIFVQTIVFITVYLRSSADKFLNCRAKKKDPKDDRPETEIIFRF